MSNVQMTVVDKTTGNRQAVYPKTVTSAVSDFEEQVKEVIRSMNLGSSNDAGVMSVSDNSTTVVNGVGITTYSRPKMFSATKDTITIYAGTTILINNNYYSATEDVTIDINSSIAVNNRNGKDVYIYATVNTDNTLQFLISLNSTTPNGYTADNSRKIGGFHCLCAAVGTIANHVLSGYATGDILPASRWDLLFRPNSEPEGMVYDEYTNIWVDIYLASYTSANGLQSIYGAATADGGSTEKFHWYKFNEFFRNVKKRLPFQYEFISAARGSNQQTNIKDSTDAVTTGGHVDTANRRMISNIGCEDMCGFLWQWGYDSAAVHSTGTSFADAFDANDSGEEKGQHYAMPYRCFLGGIWNYSSKCGSRCSYWCDSPLRLISNYGARGVSPLRPAVSI